MKIRAEISESNKYYISKHRYYELKHFCLQYCDWKKLYLELGGIRSSSIQRITCADYTDYISEEAINKAELLRKMRMVEEAAIGADTQISSYILKAVTEEYSYVHLKMMYDVPFGKDLFYDRYRKFFYILDKIRE